MANINKIKLSGTTYNIQDLNASKTVELTQAQYDALSVKDPNTFYIITDSQGADLSNYYTKSETDDLLDTKLDVTAYTPTDLSNYYTKSETSGATEISTALNAKADTLVSGSNIKTINNESILGSGNIEIQGGGGKAVSGGTNISITTGETADTINCTLPITKNSYNNGVTLGWNGNNSKDYYAVAEGYDSIANGASSHAEGNSTTASTQGSHSEGYQTIAGGIIGSYNQEYCHAEGYRTTAYTFFSHAEGYKNKVQGQASHVEGANNEIINPFGIYTQFSLVGSHAEGINNKTYNEAEHASGKFNNSVSASTTFGDSGNTLFSVGNGTADNARHNAFEIRQNGDIYITSGGADIKLQDNLGGGGGGASYSAGTGIDITNDVISVSGVVMSSAVTTAVTSASTDSEIPSAKAVYDALGQGGSITSGDVQTLIDASISGKTDESAFTSFSGSVDARFAEDEEVTAAALNALNASLSGKLDTSAYTQVVTTSAVTSGSTAVIESGAVYNALGGLKLQKISQSDYDALVQGGTVDANTLYIITNVVS